MSEVLDFFNSLQPLELALLGAGAIILLLIVVICLCFCCIRQFRYKPDAADLKLAQLYQEGIEGGGSALGRQYSANTIAKNLGAKPSTKLKTNLQVGKKAKDDKGEDVGIDTSSIKPSTASSNGEKEFAPNVMKNLDQKFKGKVPAKVNKVRNDKGKSYGRLDTEAQERIRSVRLQANELNLRPIVPASNSKALKMMGITEEDASKQYADNVSHRMKRIAQNAGGGAYSTGFSTSRLGAQIIDGFQTRREKLEYKAQQRKEKSKLQEEMTERRKTLDKKMKPIKPPTEAKNEKPKLKPKGVSAFLAEQGKPKENDKDNNESIDNDI